MDLDTVTTGKISLQTSILFFVQKSFDWRDYQFSFHLVSDDGGLSVVGKVEYNCGGSSRLYSLLDGVVLTNYNKTSLTCAETNVTLSNTSRLDLSYSLQITHIHSPLYKLPENIQQKGVLQGSSIENMNMYELNVIDPSGYDVELWLVDSVEILLQTNVTHCLLFGEISMDPHLDQETRQLLVFDPESNTYRTILHRNSPCFKANLVYYVKIGLAGVCPSVIDYFIVANFLHAGSLTPGTLLEAQVMDSDSGESVISIGSGFGSSFYSFESNRSPLEDKTSGHLVLDLRKHIYYDSICFSFQVPPEQPDLLLCISFETFFYGNVSLLCVRSQPTSPVLIQIPVLHDSLFRMGSSYYIHVLRAKDSSSISSESWIDEPMSSQVEYDSHAISQYDLLPFNTLYNYTLLMEFEKTWRREYVYEGHDQSEETINKTCITYYCIRVPKEDFGVVKEVYVSLSNVRYTYDAIKSTTYPLSLYIGHSSSASSEVPNPGDAESYAINGKFYVEESISYALSDTPELICSDCYIHVAIVTLNVTSWSISGNVTMKPFSLVPNKVYEGEIDPHQNRVISTMYLLFTSDPVPIVLRLTKVTVDPLRDIVVYASVSNYPTPKNYDWSARTHGNSPVDITVDLDDPNFCNDCRFYVSIYIVDPSVFSSSDTTPSQTSTPIQMTLNFICLDDACSVCEEGWDPAKSCSECRSGYYGDSCLRCKECFHGKCNDKISGDGSCICDVGWDPSKDCSSCLSGYYGSKCLECPSCSSHGKCRDGIDGEGTCDCNVGFDGNNCDKCKVGRYGSECEKFCPMVEGKICNDQGVCDDDILGTGRCECNDGYVGIKCDTLYADDRCVPHCFKSHGACDEQVGSCVCWDDHDGIDCNYVASEQRNLIIVCVLLLAVAFSGCWFIVYVNRKASQQNLGKEKSEESSDL